MTPNYLQLLIFALRLSSQNITYNIFYSRISKQSITYSNLSIKIQKKTKINFDSVLFYLVVQPLQIARRPKLYSLSVNSNENKQIAVVVVVVVVVVGDCGSSRETLKPQGISRSMTIIGTKRTWLLGNDPLSLDNGFRVHTSTVLPVQTNDCQEEKENKHKNTKKMWGIICYTSNKHKSFLPSPPLSFSKLKKTEANPKSKAIFTY